MNKRILFIAAVIFLTAILGIFIILQMSPSNSRVSKVSRYGKSGLISTYSSDSETAEIISRQLSNYKINKDQALLLVVPNNEPRYEVDLAWPIIVNWTPVKHMVIRRNAIEFGSFSGTGWYSFNTDNLQF